MKEEPLWTKHGPNCETHFFRNPDFFEYYENVIIPDLKQKDESKILSMGCSTGEELYSIYLLNKRKGLDCILEGMDKDLGVLEVARSGEFISTIKPDEISPHDFKELVQVGPNPYDIKIKGENMSFSQFDLLKDELPENSYDMISCFAVMTSCKGFFHYDIEQAVYKLFAGLKEEGYLCVDRLEKEHLPDFFKEGVIQNMPSFWLIRKTCLKKRLEAYVEEIRSSTDVKGCRCPNDAQFEHWGYQAGYNSAVYKLEGASETGHSVRLKGIAYMRKRMKETQKERWTWNPEQAANVEESYRKEDELFKKHFPKDEFPTIYCDKK